MQNYICCREARPMDMMYIIIYCMLRVALPETKFNNDDT